MAVSILMLLAIMLVEPVNAQESVKDPYVLLWASPAGTKVDLCRDIPGACDVPLLPGRVLGRPCLMKIGGQDVEAICPIEGQELKDYIRAYKAAVDERRGQDATPAHSTPP